MPAICNYKEGMSFSLHFSDCKICQDRTLKILHDRIKKENGHKKSKS